MKTKLIGICGKDLFMTDGDLAFKAGKEYEFIDSERARGNEFNTRHRLKRWKTEFTFKWVNEFEEGDVVVNGNGSIYIYKAGCNPVINSFYASFYEGNFYTNGLARRNNTRLATYEERCKFFERLVKEGYKWDSRKLKLTKVDLRPEDMKRGEFYKIITDSGREWVVLFDKLNGSEVEVLSACVLKSTSIYHGEVLCYVSEIAKITPASESDIEAIKKAAESFGHFFNGKAFEKGFDSWVKHVKGSYSERFLSDKVKQLNAILNERD